MAHMGAPDMRHSIGYALNWPDRSHLPVARLDLAQIGKLTFRAPEMERYPALRLAREVMARRGSPGRRSTRRRRWRWTIPRGGLGFMDMAGVVEDTLSALDPQTGPRKCRDVP